MITDQSVVGLTAALNNLADAIRFTTTSKKAKNAVPEPAEFETDLRKDVEQWLAARPQKTRLTLLEIWTGLGLIESNYDSRIARAMSRIMRSQPGWKDFGPRKTAAGRVLREWRRTGSVGPPMGQFDDL